jgi:hypothetical protein
MMQFMIVNHDDKYDDNENPFCKLYMGSLDNNKIIVQVLPLMMLIMFVVVVIGMTIMDNTALVKSPILKFNGKKINVVHVYLCF